MRSLSSDLRLHLSTPAPSAAWTPSYTSHPSPPPSVCRVLIRKSTLSPAVTFGRGDGFLAAWRSSGTEHPQSGNILYVRRFNADGTPRGGKIEIDRSRQTVFDWPAVALNSAGRGAVAWTANRFDAEILAQRLVQAAP